MHRIIRTTSENEDFQSLVAMLDEDLSIRDGTDHDFYNQFNKTTGLKQVVVCYDGDAAVGCGAFKEFDVQVAEVKRMYVHTGYRGQGIAIAVLKELERWALESGFTNCILETGKKQPEAINLYIKSGYRVMENYGQYLGIDNSVCMHKSLVNA